MSTERIEWLVSSEREIAFYVGVEWSQDRDPTFIGSVVDRGENHYVIGRIKNNSGFWYFPDADAAKKFIALNHNK